MKTIRDKVALVTGAGSGLGRAIAVRLAHEGARLHLADINSAAAAATSAQIRALRRDVAVTACDLCDPASLESLVADVHNQWGGLDILVNNAGIAWYGPTQKMTDDQWDQLLTLNLHVPITLTRRFLKTLLVRPESHVINMASICGWVCGGRFNAYHVSKFGLVGFSEALRAEFNRHGLGVTAVCPGPVLTDLYKNSGCGYGDRETPHPPAWLCTTPDCVAAKTVRASIAITPSPSSAPPPTCSITVNASPLPSFTPFTASAAPKIFAARRLDRWHPAGNPPIRPTRSAAPPNFYRL
jgi:NAD(P)-dependent dehydrogenase (short-subunit alcohol dehydrogenase family)